MIIAILADFPLHVIPELGEYFRPKGHWATWLPQLARQFGSATGFEFHWLTMSERLQDTRVVEYQGQTFHVLPTTAKGRAASLFRQDRKKINACLHKIQPDLVHGWGTEDVYAFAAVQSGYPNMVSMQGILSYYVLKNRMPGRVYLQALLELFVLRKADLITTESGWGRDVLSRRCRRSKIELVEYGVQDYFLDLKWSPDPEKPVVIFVGGVDPRKGIQDLVEAFRSPDLRGVELWVVGGHASPWGESLMQNAPKNIVWHGRKSTQETGELMRRAWCLALPTRADTSPNVVKEARVIGMPVISTRQGGQTSYVVDGETGFLVEPGDVFSLRSKLIKIISNYKLCQSLGCMRQIQQATELNPTLTAKKFFLIYGLGKNITSYL